MKTAAKQTGEEKFSFSSSVASDVWTPKQDQFAYEWWYFDAISDDGRDAIVVIFLDNFIFSPRYNAACAKNPKEKKAHFPAVAFFYYRDGKCCYRAINEFGASDFKASEKTPEGKIGDSSFEFAAAPYGHGFLIEINAQMSKKRRLEAKLEWLSIESDFLPDKKFKKEDSHSWNMVSPRADVTGKIDIKSDKGKSLDTVQFRGTGYHDHNYDNRWLPATVKDWQWGRAHFSDATAIFYRYKEIGSDKPLTKLFTISDGEFKEREVIFEEQQNFQRDKFGIKYPQRMRFVTQGGLRLRVKQTKVIDSSFFYLRFLSEMNLAFRDGKPRKTIGITEHLTPKVLKYRWLDWLINMRIGKDGKGAFLK